MDDYNAFSAFRDVLAFLYPQENDARRVAHDADINVSMIGFDKARNFWGAILVEAVKSNRIEHLIKVVHGDYSTNEALFKIYMKSLQAILVDKESDYRLTDSTEQKLQQSRPRQERSITLEWWPGGVTLSFVTTLTIVLALIWLSNQFRTFEEKLAERDKGLSQAYATQDAQSTEIALVRATATQLSEVAMLQTQPTDTSALLTTTPSPTTTPTPTATPTLTPTTTSTSTPTPTPTPTCPYEGETDNETIVNLIQAEATAANTKSITITQNIFSPDAIFTDYAQKPPKTWYGPLARYGDDLFKFVDFKEVEHFDILPVGQGIAGNMAWYTSGSKGFYKTSGSDWQEMFNGSLVSTPPTEFGSEHWTLTKNRVGCWVITQMDFNAGLIPFPE